MLPDSGISTRYLTPKIISLLWIGDETLGFSVRKAFSFVPRRCVNSSISSSSLLEDVDPSEDEDSLCRVLAFASIADRVSWASSLLSALFFGSEKLAILSNNLFLAIEGGTTDGRFVIPHANVRVTNAQ